MHLSIHLLVDFLFFLAYSIIHEFLISYRHYPKGWSYNIEWKKVVSDHMGIEAYINE